MSFDILMISCHKRLYLHEIQCVLKLCKKIYCGVLPIPRCILLPFSPLAVYTYVNMDFLVRLQVGQEIQMKII